MRGTWLNVCRLITIATLWTVVTPAAAAAQGHAPEPDYLDDRSTAEAVIGSYYDAINRKEYARAYSYREPQAALMEMPDSRYRSRSLQQWPTVRHRHSPAASPCISPNRRFRRCRHTDQWPLPECSNHMDNDADTATLNGRDLPAVLRHGRRAGHRG